MQKRPQEAHGHSPRTGKNTERSRRRLPGKMLLFAAACILFSGHGTSGRVPPSELIISPDVLAKMQAIAVGQHNEVALCLMGKVNRDTAFVNDFVVPPPRQSTSSRASFNPCPSNTLASWHNHPTPTVGGVPIADWRARWLCALSYTDIKTGYRLRFPFIVVSVDGYAWCWWTLDEVRRFSAQAISPGPPNPNRLHDAGNRTSKWGSPYVRSANQQ